MININIDAISLFLSENWVIILIFLLVLIGFSYFFESIISIIIIVIIGAAIISLSNGGEFGDPLTSSVDDSTIISQKVLPNLNQELKDSETTIDNDTYKIKTPNLIIEGSYNHNSVNITFENVKYSVTKDLLGEDFLIFINSKKIVNK